MEVVFFFPPAKVNVTLVKTTGCNYIYTFIYIICLYHKREGEKELFLSCYIHNEIIDNFAAEVETQQVLKKSYQWKH